MKLLEWSKDGGPESHVTGLFIIEIKSLFSIVLLHFAPGSREAYHSHAFNAVSWLLRGVLDERKLGDVTRYIHLPDVAPIVTRRSNTHRVISRGHSWVLSFRGPWAKTWTEFRPEPGRIGRFVTLAHGRLEVA